MTGNMTYARYQHTTTLLNNGHALTAGGFNTIAMYATVELYDPVTQQWTNPGNLTYGRYSHTASLLSNGRVLIVGGTDPATTLGLRTSELY